MIFYHLPLSAPLKKHSGSFEQHQVFIYFPATVSDNLGKGTAVRRCGDSDASTNAAKWCQQGAKNTLPINLNPPRSSSKAVMEYVKNYFTFNWESIHIIASGCYAQFIFQINIAQFKKNRNFALSK